MADKPRYRVLVPFGFPADERIRDRIAGGENIPFDQRGTMVEHPVGRVTTNVDERSVPWLLKQGVIELVEKEGS